LLEPPSKALEAGSAVGGLVLTVDVGPSAGRRDHIRAMVEALIQAGDRFTASPDMIEYLRHCWLPGNIVRHWMARRGFEWPPHFKPEMVTSAVSKRRPPRRPPQSKVNEAVAMCVRDRREAGQSTDQKSIWDWAKGPDGIPGARRDQIVAALLVVVPRDRGRPSGTRNNSPK
jgi:hypothetical protein